MDERPKKHRKSYVYYKTLCWHCSSSNGNFGLAWNFFQTKHSLHWLLLRFKGQSLAMLIDRCVSRCSSSWWLCAWLKTKVTMATSIFHAQSLDPTEALILNWKLNRHIANFISTLEAQTHTHVHTSCSILSRQFLPSKRNNPSTEPWTQPGHISALNVPDSNLEPLRHTKRHYLWYMSASPTVEI